MDQARHFVRCSAGAKLMLSIATPAAIVLPSHGCFANQASQQTLCSVCRVATLPPSIPCLYLHDHQLCPRSDLHPSQGWGTHSSASAQLDRSAAEGHPATGPALCTPHTAPPAPPCCEPHLLAPRLYTMTDVLNNRTTHCDLDSEDSMHSNTCPGSL